MKSYLFLILLLTFIYASPAFALFGGGKKDDGPKEPITSCGTPGDICSDGTLLVGLFCPDEGKNLNSCVRLFAPPYDQATLTTWKSKDFEDDIKNDSDNDGDSNQGQVNPIKKFPAFQKCQELNYADRSDWYLPSKKELDAIFKVRSKIENFVAQNYWSSTEGSDKKVWVQSFASGAKNQQTKNQKLYVRCVRREKIHKNAD